MATKRQSLGKGLDALLGMTDDTDFDAFDSPTSNAAHGQLRELAVDLLQRGKYQPRRDFDVDALEELADSIRSQGIMQPLVVRQLAGEQYEIIAGERRWRAAQQAGLDTVPVIVRKVSDEAAIAMALIENIQREDLNAMEESLALQRLQQEFQLTQQQVADAVGKSRSAVTNLMRLTGLQLEVQKLLERGDLELGHAKCLLALDGSVQVSAARNVVGTSMTVRQTEALVKKLQSGDTNSPAAETQSSPDIKRLENDISEKIGVPVSIQHNAKGAGKLIFKYSSVDELDGILDHLK
ncbi:ParB/RepB/Spo0J family partition protein [SAR92 clade bacterium H455]|uniref:Probable chromosome-partitioning protein ParB n=1 Tax=SAR92 clade bacterium H455 TaxID=2974818 RepID=A0ABY5TMW4_9GAMM|nr:ParB/RepB/Spo0J family partition protein [SAR92 clade bacterium H455]